MIVAPGDDRTLSLRDLLESPPTDETSKPASRIVRGNAGNIHEPMMRGNNLTVARLTTMTWPPLDEVMPARWPSYRPRRAELT